MADDPYPLLTPDQAPELQAGEIHLWLADLTALPPIPLELSPLCDSERKRAERLKIPVKRELFIAGRSMLRQLLGSYLGLPPAAVKLAYGPHGKPSLTYGYPLEFNLSHSGSLAALVLSRCQPVGIDLEQIDTRRDVRALSQRFFSAAERELLAPLEGDALRCGFYRTWCAKEAFIKATGLGLSQPLGSFSVPLADGPVRLEGRDDGWHVCHLDAPAGYVMALVQPTPIGSLRRFHLAG